MNSNPAHLFFHLNKNDICRNLLNAARSLYLLLPNKQRSRGVVSLKFYKPELTLLFAFYNKNEF